MIDVRLRAHELLMAWLGGALATGQIVSSDELREVWDASVSHAEWEASREPRPCE